MKGVIKGDVRSFEVEMRGLEAVLEKIWRMLKDPGMIHLPMHIFIYANNIGSIKAITRSRP